jgi:polysaccharide pyruvyl transferase WcaK-like protein
MNLNKLGRKVLVLSPAGRIYNHDNVEWYAHLQSKIEASYFNIGDMVVYDSTLKLLDFTDVQGCNIVNPTEKNIEFYKGFDYFIVRASNFIHNNMEWERALDVLNSVQLPIFAIGVGAQASGSGTYKLEGKNLQFWKTVSERSTVIGVRGAFTAELLAANGIKNVEIVGCPSIFRACRRNLRIEQNAKIERVAFSIRREADSSYASEVTRYREVQRELLLQFARRFDVRVTIHGEIEEKAFFYRNREMMARAREIFAHEQWWTPETKDEMEAIYRDRLFFFLKVADYDDFIRTQDLAVGYRVHGVLPALANGVPGILVKYDSRSTELANTHSIPSIELSDVDSIDIDRLITETSFSDFNKIFAMRYDKMQFVLEQNGLQHRMS